MGNRPQPDRELPAFVSSFNDRHGKTRYRFRRFGGRSYYFQSPVGSDEFSTEYDGCLSAGGGIIAWERISESEKARVMAERLRSLMGKPDAALIYAVGEIDGPIKVGTALSPAGRLHDLQIGNPRKLIIEAMRIGGRDTELQIHRKLSRHRIQGEWFARDAVTAVFSPGVWLTRHDFLLSNLGESDANAG